MKAKIMTIQSDRRIRLWNIAMDPEDFRRITPEAMADKLIANSENASSDIDVLIHFLQI